MKKIYISILLIHMAIMGLDAQRHVNIGGGYFGQTITYPGLVLEVEMEHMFSERTSLPLRMDVGFYVHPRQSTGVFLDLNAGFRRYFKSGLFLEESVGLGLLQSFLHSDAVYAVDDSGNVSETSRSNPPEFMPSVTFGVGYNLTQGSGKQNLIWLRPKLYWQVPHKTVSAFNFALQVGFTHTISTRQ
jgi:hypothetical protein